MSRAHFALNDTLAVPRVPRSDFSSIHPPLAPTLPTPLTSLISLFGPVGFASESVPVRVGRCRHIQETAAGVCGVPKPQACGEAVMARLSASPSPVIRRVNTAPRSVWGRGGAGGREGASERAEEGGPSGSCPAPSLELSRSNFEVAAVRREEPWPGGAGLSSH